MLTCLRHPLYQTYQVSLLWHCATPPVCITQLHFFTTCNIWRRKVHCPTSSWAWCVSFSAGLLPPCWSPATFSQQLTLLSPLLDRRGLAFLCSVEALSAGPVTGDSNSIAAAMDAVGGKFTDQPNAQQGPVLLAWAVRDLGRASELSPGDKVPMSLNSANPLFF